MAAALEAVAPYPRAMAGAGACRKRRRVTAQHVTRRRVCVLCLQVVKNQAAYYHQARVEIGVLQFLNTRADPGDRHHIVRLKVRLKRPSSRSLCSHGRAAPALPQPCGACALCCSGVALHGAAAAARVRVCRPQPRWAPLNPSTTRSPATHIFTPRACPGLFPVPQPPVPGL